MGSDSEGVTTSVGRRIGELAAVTGLTVRTLHYYEEIGLLVPSRRTEAGHRLYDDADVARLYRICLLRRLGLPLAEIGRALDDATGDLRVAMTSHLRELDRRLEAEQRLRARLAAALGSLGLDRAEGTQAITDDLLTILEEMTMLESTLQRRISILVYADLEAAHRYLVDVFGLGSGELTRDADGTPVHGELQAGDGVVWLHPVSEPFGLASPSTLGKSTATIAVIVDDVDEHFVHARDRGAEILYEPVDQPYGYREYSAHDCEGHLWSFMKPLD